MDALFFGPLLKFDWACKMNEKRYTNSQKATLNTISNIASKLIILVSSFITKTIMIKTLGVDYAGVSSLFTDILTLFSFAELGIGPAIIFELYKPIKEKDNKKIAELMNFYKSAYQLIGSIILIVGILLIPMLPFLVKNVPNIHESVTVIYVFYLLNTVISYFLIYKSSLLTANQENYLVSTIQGIFSILRLIIGSIILIGFHNFLVYLTLDIVMLAIQNFIIYKIADRKFIELKEYKNSRLNQKDKKKLFNNVGALSLYQVSNVILNSTDSIVISTMMGTGFVTYFANYRLIVRSVDNFISQVTTSLTPTLGIMAVDKEKSQKETFQLLNMFIFWLTINSTLLIYFLTPTFIEIWLGKSFLMSNWLLIGFVLEYFFLNMVRPVATFRNANGLFIQGKYRPVIMSIINIIFSFLLLKLFGIVGVIWGTVLSRILTQVWYDPIIVFRHVFKEKATSYFYSLFFQIVFLCACCLLTTLLSNIILFSNHLFIQLIQQFFITIVICNLLFMIVYRKNPEFIKLTAFVKRKLIRK